LKGTNRIVMQHQTMITCAVSREHQYNGVIGGCFTERVVNGSTHVGMGSVLVGDESCIRFGDAVREKRPHRPCITRCSSEVLNIRVSIAIDSYEACDKGHLWLFGRLWW